MSLYLKYKRFTLKYPFQAFWFCIECGKGLSCTPSRTRVSEDSCRTLGHGVSTASWLTPQARITRTCVLPISQPCQLSPGRYGKHVLQTKTDSRLPLSVKTSSLRNDDIWVTRLDRSAVSSVNEVSAVLLPNSWLLLILFVSQLLVQISLTLTIIKT